MAQAQGQAHGTDVGSTFLKADSPWMICLAALKEEWVEAHEVWEKAQFDVKYLGLGLYAPQLNTSSPDFVVAKIVDIDTDNNIVEWRTLTKKDLFCDPTCLASVVNDFISGFRDSQPLLHTRILLLHGKEWCSSSNPVRYGSAMVRLLYGHLLAVELDMGLVEVCSFVGCTDSRPFGQTLLPRVEHSAATIGVGYNSWNESDFKCSRIGTRTVNGNAVDHVVIDMNHFWLERFKNGRIYKEWSGIYENRALHRWSDSTGYGLREPPTASDIFRNGATHSPLDMKSAEASFIQILKSSEWTKEPTEASIPRWHWLGAILRMSATRYSFAVQDLLYVKGSTRVQSETDRERCFELANILRELTEATLMQVQAFVEDNCKLNSKDFTLDLKLLRRVTEMANALANNTRIEYERMSTKKTIQLSESAISESRSAIALTVLAFVFVPISLASSIFGMNVRQINHTGHSIWHFIVTAVVMLALSVSSYVIWRVLEYQAFAWR